MGETRLLRLLHRQLRPSLGLRRRLQPVASSLPLPSLFQPGSFVDGLLADLKGALGFVGGILGELLGLVSGLLGGITKIVNDVALALLQKVDGVVVLLQRFLGGLSSVLAKFDFCAQPIGLSFHFGTVGDLLDCYSVMNIINPSFSPVC
ncbi:hypothetical protein L596_014120 [Steinernema carpocapsae]|uniref:Uncharacterized protein n=1 Tax=Steinernema carpocapsae TaxID=34508 RepID=A0A4U5NBT0_STECR|nr:hypothetical protein L596_014120 [Steinernema carpocapsae]